MVSETILTPRDWTRELPLDLLLGGKKRLEVELGCGKGRFLLARARAHPGTAFLGIDRLLARLRKVARKIDRAALTNVRLLRIEAAYAIRYLLPDRSVSVFYVFFPDPWPKRRHHRRRLFQPGIMDALHDTLVPAGSVYLASDHADYLAGIRTLFEGDTRFEPTDALEPTEDEQSDFERLFRSQGKAIGRLGFRRTE